MPEIVGASDAQISRGFSSPLSPDAIAGDLDIGALADRTAELLRSGYKKRRAIISVGRPEGTIQEMVTASLFDGDQDRSQEGYDTFVGNPDTIIGPYVRRMDDDTEPMFGLALYDDLRRGMRKQEGDVSWGIVGTGTIGGRIIEQLGSTDIAERDIAERSGLSIVPDFVLRKTTGITYDGENSRPLGKGEELPDVDVLFVATPGIGGEESPVHEHIVRQLERRGIVVTAEKASLAEHFDEYRALSGDFARLGINATVGGGTRLLEELELHTHDLRNVNELHLGLNGTLAYISGQVAHGVAAGIAVDEAVSLGYAEPDALEVEDVIRGEATGDIPRKVAVVMSKLLVERAVDPAIFKFDLSGSEIQQALRESNDRRFITSIYRAESVNGRDEQLIGDVIGGFASLVDDWLVVGGFQRMSNNPLTSRFREWHGASAGAVIGLGPNNKDGVYPVGGGPGAGMNPTANVMLDDAQVLIARQRNL